MTRICVSDHQAEAILNFCEVTWIVKKISMEDIDWDASRANHARLWQHENADVVVQYVTAMEAGDEFPLVVVEASENGFIILGGNRRMAAMKELGDTDLMAYVLKPLATLRREVVIRSLNSRHGEGISREERMAQSVHMVLSCDVAIKDAARLQSLTYRSVLDHVKAAKVTQRLAKVGLDVSKLPTQHLAAISQISHDSQAQRLARVVLEHKPSLIETRDIVAVVQASPSVKKTVQRIDEFESQLEAARAIAAVEERTIQRPIWRRFTMALGGLATILEQRGNTLDELQVLPEDAESVIERANLVIRRLRLLTGAK